MQGFHQNIVRMAFDTAAFIFRCREKTAKEKNWEKT